MNKKKKWVINIALIALSLCIMIYGIYAAKQASLTVNGTIGFKAHGISFAVTQVTVAEALNAEGEIYSIDRDNAEMKAINDGTAQTYTGDGELVLSKKETETDSTFYFDDLSYSTGEADNLKPIVITLKIVNTSMFAVQIDEVTMATNATENGYITYTVSVDYGETDEVANTEMAAAPVTGNLEQKGGECTVIITLTLVKNENTYQKETVTTGGPDDTSSYEQTTEFAATLAATNFNVPIALHIAAEG